MTRTLASLACAPLYWLFGLGTALAATLIDLLATPWLLVPRAADAGTGLASRDTSVIVLNYNGAHFLRALLPSLQAALDVLRERVPGTHEVIVVDNGSDDDSAALVAREHPAFRLVKLPENRFFIRGNRAGVEAAKGDVLVFVNNDMRVEPEFLVRLVERLDAPDVFAVTARIEMDGDRVETGRTRADWRRGAVHLVQVEAPEGAAAPVGIPALWAGGGSSAFDRRKFDLLGGFEDLYEPCYAEDLSLSYRAWRRGWRVLFAPDAIVHHAHRGTSSVVFGEGHTNRLDRRNRELWFWRSITDPAMAWSHAIWLPWNAHKDARRMPHRQQVRALLAALPRLPRALLLRQDLRAHARRGDHTVLDVANSVRRHRRMVARGTMAGERPVVLSIGCADGAAPQGETFDVSTHTITLPPDTARFAAARSGTVADQVRDLVREVDHDVVVFRDPFALAAAPTGTLDHPVVLHLDAFEKAATPPEREREGERLYEATASVFVIVCTTDDDEALARRSARRTPRSRDTLAAVLDRIVGELP